MPTIEFSTFNEDTLKDSKPVLAKSIKPEWWNNMKFHEYNRGIKQATIRSCPAMDDWLKSGWYLLSNRDIIVKNGRLDGDTGDQCHICRRGRNPEICLRCCWFKVREKTEN